MKAKYINPRIANFNEKELSEYEASLKKYRDLKGVIDTAFEEGEKIGFEEGFEKGAKAGLEQGEKVGLEQGEKIGLAKGEKIGLEQGEKIGFDKGKDEKARQMAKLLKEDGIAVEKISAYTGFSPEEINQL